MSPREVQLLVARAAESVRPRPVMDAFVDALWVSRGLGRDDECPLLRHLGSDPHFQSLLLCDDALGQVRQAVNAPALEAAYRATARTGRKFTRGEVPVVTQLFTPRWVAEFLVQNTLGRLWLATHPDSGLAARMPWLVSGCDPAGPAPPVPRRAIDIRLLDPACGTMNFGLVAADLLTEMYGEERDRAGRPGWPAEPSVSTDTGRCILRHNLHGIDVDAAVLGLARVSLALKFGLPDLLEDDCNLRRGDALVAGAGPRGRPRTFDVVVTNPPYLSARNLPGPRVRRLKEAFPTGWRDLYACFLLRCLDLLSAGGRAGVLAMHTFMFTGGYEDLRSELTRRSAVEALAHFGPGLFGVGNRGTLQTVAALLRREDDAAARDRQRVTVFRLVDPPDADSKRGTLAGALREHDGTVHVLPQRELKRLPRGAWSYWATPADRRAFRELPTLATGARPRQGLATTDNVRFVRFWWEVEPAGADPLARATPGRWLPYVKAGRFRRWYEAPRHRVNWEDDGREIKAAIVDRYPYLNGQWQWVAKNAAWYGRGGVTYSYLTSGRFSARLLPRGALFDVAGSSLFPDDPLTLLGVLNSAAAARLLHLINPSVNFQVGDLAGLPVPGRTSDALRELVARAVEAQRALEAFDETSPQFASPLTWDEADERWRILHAGLASLESAIDVEVSALYGMPPVPGASSIRAAATTALNREDLARRWVSFALGLELGRWIGRVAADVIQVLPPDQSFLSRLRDRLAERAGPSSVAEIEAAVGGLGSFLARDFLPWHVRLYRRRPVYWAFGGAGQCYLLRHDRATAERLRPVLGSVGAALPERWERHVDDGVLANLAPLRHSVPDRLMRRALNDFVSHSHRNAWSLTFRDSPLRRPPARRRSALAAASAPQHVR